MRPLRPGEYRHTPGPQLEAGPDGVLRPVGGRRRFPHLGLVFLAYGLLTPGVCAGAALFLRQPALRPYAVTRLHELPLPPQPTVANVLFGAGLHELALAGALAGVLLWRVLWTRPARPGRAAWRDLLPTGLLLGPLVALAGTVVAAFGLFLRAAPAEIPALARPFFALLSVPFTVAAALSTPTIPLTLGLLGLLLGGVTAAAVALTWPHFPPET